eukprot:204947-Amphidinium_carterae.2
MAHLQKSTGGSADLFSAATDARLWEAALWHIRALYKVWYVNRKNRKVQSWERPQAVGEPSEQIYRTFFALKRHLPEAEQQLTRCGDWNQTYAWVKRFRPPEWSKLCLLATEKSRQTSRVGAESPRHALVESTMLVHAQPPPRLCCMEEVPRSSTVATRLAFLVLGWSSEV